MHVYMSIHTSIGGVHACLYEHIRNEHVRKYRGKYACLYKHIRNEHVHKYRGNICMSI